MSFAATAIVGTVVGGLASREAGKEQAGGAVSAAEIEAQSIREAQEIAKEAARKGRGFITGQFEPSLSALQRGFRQGIETTGPRTPAAKIQAALSGVLGPEAQQKAIDDFIESPGQQFLRDEQEEALLRNAAAIGGVGGGRVRSALQEQALGRAAGLQQQTFANLGEVADREQLTQANIANLQTQRGGAVSALRTGFGANLANIEAGLGAQQTQLAQNIGTAQAGGVRGASAAEAAGTLGIGSAFQQGAGQLAFLSGMRRGFIAPPTVINPAMGGGGAQFPSQFSQRLT
jgi:hypothetical protein